MTDPSLTVAQVAQRLGFSASAIRRAIDRGELEASKLCGRLRISEGAVAAFVAAGAVTPKAPAPSGHRVAVVTPSRPAVVAGSFRERLRAREQA